MSKSLVRLSPARPGPVTELLWLDSVGSNGWSPLEKQIATNEEILHRSVGYLTSETDLAVTITQSVGGSGNYDHSLTIPKVALVKRTARR